MSAKIARAIDTYTSKPEATIWAIETALAWLVAGPPLHYSNLWLSFGGAFFGLGPYVMCFALRDSAARDAIAMHAKIDAQRFAIPAADNRLIRVEKLAYGKVEELHAAVCSTDQLSKLAT